MKIAALNIYPLKSARGIALTESQCGLSGLAGDRIAVITDPKGQFITQRELPALARLSAQLRDDGLVLDMDGEAPIAATPQGADRFNVTVWKDTVNAAGAAETVNEKLSEWLGQPVRLAFFDQHAARIASTEWVETETPVSFADGFQILVTTTGSLAALNADLSSHGAETVGMERFRPNIVLDCEEPWAEDGWSGIEIVGIRLDFVKPCARCIMTTQDQTTGSRDGANPIPAMGRLRMSADRRVPGPLFGWNAVPRGEGLLSVGDTVEITGMRDENWPLKKRR
nr:MOSC domain-containing protein [Marinicella sp. W31]MDC2876760.1 MOSC domain-containing protein [Marinicella sp. W31]